MVSTRASFSIPITDCARCVQKLSAYKRHAFTDNGVSPLAVPGDALHVVVTDSDEHDEEGHLIEDAATRTTMTEKRVFRKTAEHHK